MPEFAKFLLKIEKTTDIIRIIPGRISRQQKGSSKMMFRTTTPTQTWIKCIMSKWATAQELFVICEQKNIDKISDEIKKISLKYIK